MSWQEEINRIWENIKQERQEDIDFELYPYLNCTSEYYKPRSHLDRYFSAIHTRPPERSWNPKFTVWNSGSFPAWDCHVEVRENPGDILKAQTIITLQPGASCDVTLAVTTGQSGTSLVGVCYDPIFDPLEPGDPSGRKVTPLALIMTLSMGFIPRRTPGLRY